jgi:hypothetical protein
MPLLTTLFNYLVHSNLEKIQSLTKIVFEILSRGTGKSL